MGALTKLIDAILFVFFFVIALAAPLIDGQAIFPLHFYPTTLVDLKNWYSNEYGDYLTSEKPHFFVGILWLELLFQWPLALACLYGIAASKSWFNTTCLIFGVSSFSCMAAIVAELSRSERASDKLLMTYYPFMGSAALAILRGLLPHSGKTTAIGQRPVLNRKKRA